MPTSRVRFAVHAHSDWSYDGRFGLPTVARILRALGYRGALMSEHDRGFDEARWLGYQEACARASSESFLLVPGIEYSSADNSVHVPTWGDLPFLGEELDTGAALQRIATLGGAAVFAHPSRHGAWRKFSPEWAPHLLGVEIWNVKQDGYAPSADGVDLWRRHPELVPFASLDFHTPRQIFPLAMEITVTGAITRAAVQAALEAKQVRGLAFTSPAERFVSGRGLEFARQLERSRYWAFRHVKRIVKGHY
jgi:hypothetical protein